MEIAILTGRWVQLEPLEERHRDALRTAADDERIWVHTLMVARGPEFDRWFDDTLAQRSAGRQVPFAVRGLADQVLVGSTSYLDPVPRHRRVEIGATWYTPNEWGTQINPECKLLLLTHAFDVLGMNRVQLCTDARNTRSQAAIAKLGAVKEGILRAHMITQGDRIRDSVLFSIARGDWPQVQARLTARLTGAARPRTTDISIRAATEADIPALGRLAEALGRQHIAYDAGRYQLPADVPAAFAELFSSHLHRAESVLLVADRGGELVGYVFGLVDPANVVQLTGRAGWIHDLYVAPAARGTGLGSRLLDEALRRLRALGCPGGILLGVAPQNATAAALFRRYGFRPTLQEMTLGPESL
jgi:RimJ/RimL family protein N-acetyltransferase